tara:strand:- start:89 stop:736 length:648 start_codon:yes stop_codon:yes gene_type:complete
MVKRGKLETAVTNNFIGCWDIDKKICEEIISFYEKNPDDVSDGTSGGRVNTEVKLSHDISIRPNQLADDKYHIFIKYMNLLKKCYVDYLEQWPHLKTLFDSVEVSAFNIQKYYSGGHFKKHHMERTNILNSSRIFAWMTYLNNVSDGGTTDFLYYDLSVKPEKGKTLIWPAEWTHAHRGGIVNDGVKYIITGWFHMPDNLNYDVNAPDYGLPIKK